MVPSMKQLYIIDVNIAVIISVLYVVEVKRHKFIVAGVLFFSCTILFNYTPRLMPNLTNKLPTLLALLAVVIPKSMLLFNSGIRYPMMVTTLVIFL